MGQPTDPAAQPLDESALAAELDTLPAWTGGGDGISRTAELPDFPTAIEVVDRVAVVAERVGHHPDIDIRWRTVTFRLVTHSAGSRVTGADVALARIIDDVIATAR